MGFKSDSEIANSFSAFIKSNLAILISGLFFFERFSASFKFCGILTIAFEFFCNCLGLFIWPIIFS